MCKLRDLEQIGRDTREQFSRPLFVIETERKRLDVRKDVAAHICFYADSEQMAPVIDDVKHHCPHDVCGQYGDQQCDKGDDQAAHICASDFKLRKQLLHNIIRKQWKPDIYSGNEGCADDVQKKQTSMRLVISHKSFDFVHIIIITHPNKKVHVVCVKSVYRHHFFHSVLQSKQGEAAMDRTRLYRDIVKRTKGDIYIGVVGPVRTGKSTFIKRFAELLVLPNIVEEQDRSRVIDELPQSGNGRSIMTTQPHFIPNEAVSIQLDESISCRVRLVDCVGYMVPDAVGSMEGDEVRMVTTPWCDEDIPFEDAARIGTQKVIHDHSTVGIIVTTDGTISELPRGNYRDAEERVIFEVMATKKPFIVVVNSQDPMGDRAAQAAGEIHEKFGIEPVILDLLHLSERSLTDLLQEMLLAFPLTKVTVKVPNYLHALKENHPLLTSVLHPLQAQRASIRSMRDCKQLISELSECESYLPARLESLSPGDGTAVIAMQPKEGIFYSVLSDTCGVNIADDCALLEAMSEFVKAKSAYDKISNALDKAQQTGYGIVPPDISEMELEEPELMSRGGKFGIRLRAKASGLHIVRVDTDCEVNPIVGTEQQSEALMQYFKDTFASDPSKIWEANLFGKSLYDLVCDGMQGRMNGMNETVQQRMQGAIQRIVNSDCNNLICIMI